MAESEGGWTEEAVQALLVNPFYAVTAAPTFCVPHEPMIERDAWVRANARLIEQIGAEAWLGRLLDVLESGGPGAPMEPPAETPRPRRRYRLPER